LPFFSKITLKNAIINLNGLGFKVALVRIDIDPNFLKTIDCKPARNATSATKQKTKLPTRHQGIQAPSTASSAV